MQAILNFKYTDHNLRQNWGANPFYFVTTQKNVKLKFFKILAHCTLYRCVCTLI